MDSDDFIINGNFVSCSNLVFFKIWNYFSALIIKLNLKMKRILLLSDTHSYIDDRILDYAKDADEVWHCGDFGNMKVIEELEKIKSIRGVYGNIDEAKIRTIFPEVLSFKCEEVDVLMIHIGGYPERYSALAKA